jgi:hypothetical protein
MKKIFVITIYIFVLTLVRCADTLTPTKDTSPLTNTLSAKATGLISEWTTCTTMSSTGDSIICIMANLCTKINFKADNTVIVTKPSYVTETLQWKASNNKVTLTNINPANKDNVYFNDGIYEMTFTEKKEYTELKLTFTEKNYSYLLARSD